MDYNQIGNVIFALGTTGWIPIWALFEGIAKCIRAFKGTDVTIEEFRSNDDEDLEENETKEENNVTKQKTKRTRTTTKTAKDSSQN